MGIARYVNLSFVVAGLLLYVVLGGLFSVTLELFSSDANAQVLGSNFRVGHLLGLVSAAGLAIWARRNLTVHAWAMEVGSELSKVSWPTWTETKKATWVVIATTLAIAALLGLLDWVFLSLSNWFYA
jgi:preprotein translocase subunit SecE